MRFARLIILTIQIAFGFFVLSQGIDCLKVEHFGIRLLTVQWLANITTLSYHIAGVVCVVLGAVLILAGAAICHRMEKDIVAANPDIPPPKSPTTVFLVGALLGFAGLLIVSKWFPTGAL
jgi:hypothetical protein